MPLLTHEETCALVLRAQAGDGLAMARLVECNQGLVRRFVRGWLGRDDRSMDDLMQDGTLGLMRAVESFDVSRGFRFSTYAVSLIRRFTDRAGLSVGHVIRVAEHAARAGVRHRVTSLSDELTDDGLRLEDVLVGHDGRDLIGQLAEADHADRVRSALDSMDPRLASVLRARFGLGDDEPKTLAEIATAMALSRERVRQLETQAIDALRDQLRRAPSVKATEPSWTMPERGWLPIIGTDGRYEINTLGVVRRALPGRGTFAGRIMSNTLGYRRKGPMLVWLGARESDVGQVSMIRLLCERFHGPPPTPRHRAVLAGTVGETPLTPQTVRWRTREEGALVGAKSPLSEDDVRFIFSMRTLIQARELAAAFRIHRTTITLIWNRTSFGNITRPLGGPDYPARNDRNRWGPYARVVSWSEDGFIATHRLSCGHDLTAGRAYFACLRSANGERLGHRCGHCIGIGKQRLAAYLKQCQAGSPDDAQRIA